MTTQIIPSSSTDSGVIYSNSVGNSWSSLLWPLANKAFYVPLSLVQAVTITSVYLTNGTVAAGHFDIGCYTIALSRIFSTGSTAMSGTDTVQSVTLGASHTLTPGNYLMACAMDTTTARIMAQSLSSVPFNVVAGIKVQTSAFALPSTAVPVNTVNDFLPLFGFVGL